MTDSTFMAKRHVPEEELHAYLDQALSRSQCVEIESHLADCSRCQDQRDTIAALRDQTTSLLAALAPASIRTPPFGEIRERYRQRAQRRRQLIRRSAWAASVLLALGFGWGAHGWSDRFGAAPQAEGQVGDRIATVEPPARPNPVMAAGPSREAPTSEAPSSTDRVGIPLMSTDSTPAPVTVTDDPPDAAEPVFRGRLSESPDLYEPALEFTSTLLSAGDELASEGLWRSLSWDGAQDENSDEWIPRVGGLPVVDVQVKRAAGKDQKPLMVVSQRLSTGQIVRTFEGPTAEVSELLSRQTGQSVTASLQLLDNDSVVGDSLPPGPEPQRILAIQGSVPVDSLRALLLRLR